MTIKQLIEAERRRQDEINDPPVNGVVALMGGIALATVVYCAVAVLIVMYG